MTVVFVLREDVATDGPDMEFTVGDFAAVIME